MNKTKKLTQGAMMLAIVGAMILIDRLAAYFFTELIVLLVPIVVIMYSTMHSLSDGMVLSVGLIIISFLLGNFRFIYLIYVPVGIVTGLVYSWGIKRGLDKRTLMLMAIGTYVVGEVIATFIVYPLLGFPVGQMIAEYKEALNQAGSLTGFSYTDIFANLGMDFGKIIVVVYILSTILMGALEGVLIHLLSIFMLKRFKIKDLGNISLWDLKPNKFLAYLSMICLFGMFFVKDIQNETLYYIGISVAIMGAMVLSYYGYLFVMLYGQIVARKNVGGIFMLLAMIFPMLFVILMVMGFLCGTGPLSVYLEEKRNIEQ